VAPAGTVDSSSVCVRGLAGLEKSVA